MKRWLKRHFKKNGNPSSPRPASEVTQANVETKSEFHAEDVSSRDAAVPGEGAPLAPSGSKPMPSTTAEAPVDIQDSSAHLSSSVVHNHGPVYIIEKAQNVFSGINYGTVTMLSADTKFMANLHERLKVSAKADYMYYPRDGENGLRRGGCTPGTRIRILDTIIRWVFDTSKDSEKIFWVSGQAGSGKTTITFTIAQKLERVASDGKSQATLGGSFFCSRLFFETRFASSIVCTIVYQLSLKSPAFQAALEVWGRFETVNHGPEAQLMGLLVEPWGKSAAERASSGEPCYVLPVDALDELEGRGGAEFLSALFDVVEREDLTGLKFLIASRSDPALVKQIEGFSKKQVCRLEEVPLEESNADINLFLNESLAECITADQIEQLVADAAGLFIYAATAVEYVRGRSVEEQKCLVKRLLSASPTLGATAPLDRLYLQILDTSLVDPRDIDDPDALDNSLSILHTFLSAIERISTSVAASILSVGGDGATLEVGFADGVLHRLHSVLYTHCGRVMWFHASFPDFIFNQRRSQRYFCDLGKQHHRLAIACFEIMTRELRFNIANISSSYNLDSENEELPSSVEANISHTLQYACEGWDRHLSRTSQKEAGCFAGYLHDLIRLRILFWIEAMQLMGKRGRCQGMLRVAQSWVSLLENASHLYTKLADVIAFVTYHSTSKAVMSTPHLYLSSLATFPRQSITVDGWRRNFGGVPGFVGADGPRRQGLVASYNVGESVAIFAVSPDGTNVAVGSWDGSVGVWDLATGEEVTTLRRHTRQVAAVAYSPDGTQLLSCAEDQTVLVWNLTTCKATSLALSDHDRSGVRSVACFPDGTHVAGGSRDSSVRVWNLSTGEEVRTLKGHTESVAAVAISLDGTCIVSGSDDNTIRVWAFESGRLIQELMGHGRSVETVAFSPDGTRVVSGSRDTTVRVWTLTTGEELRRLEGHIDTIWAVAYSPDGSQVASGSSDSTVRIWDISAGATTKIFSAHRSSVWAVAFLPGGTHVVSGSSDESIRVWDLSVEEEKEAPKGHQDTVKALLYSPDGSFILSGSNDKSIRLWNASTGQASRVLIGHTGPIEALAYSPDGIYAVSGSRDGCVRIWDLVKGEVEKMLEGQDWVNSVAFSPEGTRVVSGSRDGLVRVWDITTGDVRTLTSHTGEVIAAAFSPDGTHVVSSATDRPIHMVDLSTGQAVQTFPQHRPRTLTAAAYSPDGTNFIFSSGVKKMWVMGNSLWVRNIITGDGKALLRHKSLVKTVAYSPDGSCVAAGFQDHCVGFSNLSLEGDATILAGHTGIVTAVACCPDGIHIASGSTDNTIRIWDVSPAFRPRFIRQRDEEEEGRYTGWLLSPFDPSSRLMFVSPEAGIPDEANILTCPPSAVPQLDFSKAKFGTEWADCYTPMSTR